MKDFQKKGKWKSVLSTKPFLLLLAIIILFFAYNTVAFIGKMNDTVRNRKIVEERVRELELTKEKLDSDINKLNTEKGVEESIREKFGLAHENEQMILIVDDNTKSSAVEVEEGGFWNLVKGWFK